MLITSIWQLCINTIESNHFTLLMFYFYLKDDNFIGSQRLRDFLLISKTLFHVLSGPLDEKCLIIRQEAVICQLSSPLPCHYHHWDRLPRSPRDSHPWLCLLYIQQSIKSSSSHVKLVWYNKKIRTKIFSICVYYGPQDNSNSPSVLLCVKLRPVCFMRWARSLRTLDDSTWHRSHHNQHSLPAPHVLVIFIGF